jgi:hypothetical protein
MALVEAAERSRQAGRLAASRTAFAEAAVVAAEEEDDRALALAALGVGGIWVYEQRDFLQRAALDALWRRAGAAAPAGSLVAARLDVRTAAEAVYEGGPVEAVLGRLLEVLAARRGRGRSGGQERARRQDPQGRAHRPGRREQGGEGGRPGVLSHGREGGEGVV